MGGFKDYLNEGKKFSKSVFVEITHHKNAIKLLSKSGFVFNKYSNNYVEVDLSKHGYLNKLKEWMDDNGWDKKGSGLVFFKNRFNKL